MEFLDSPIGPKALFGVTVTAMRQQCDLRKREREAFEVCLPRKPVAVTYHPSWPSFRPLGKVGQSDYQPYLPTPL